MRALEHKRVITVISCLCFGLPKAWQAVASDLLLLLDSKRFNKRDAKEDARKPTRVTPQASFVLFVARPVMSVVYRTWLYHAALSSKLPAA